ncbi:MAG: alginate export family protein [Planctomycetota bacterium]
MIASALLLLASWSPIPPATPLQDDESSFSLAEALSSGRTWLDLNYRVEYADQANRNRDAYASTLRTALGYETADYYGFKGLLEFEDISNLGNDIYNSTTNGETDRPVVADPDSTEINQAYLSYTSGENLEARLGRQEIAYGNHRFIGTVAWRQNHQSFDAGRIDWTSENGTRVSYAYLDSVRRIFGENSPNGKEKMGSHLLDVRHKIEGVGDFAAYGYFLDFDRSTAFNSLTVGARLSGSQAIDEERKFLYTLEYATQDDAASNPVEIDQDYWLAEVGIDLGPATIRLGNEHLGGSGNAGDKFSTPLATLHKFNGFADLFLATPDTGIEDRYLQVSGKIRGVTCAATMHIFESDSGDIDYGKEFNFTALYPLNERTKLGAKLASFSADDAFTDTDRAMVWINYRVL